MGKIQSLITVTGNDQVVTYVDSLLEKVNHRNNPDTSFAQTFYDNVELSENGIVTDEWSMENLGSTHTILTDDSGGAYFSIDSNILPKKFFIHLYRLSLELDEETYIDVTYADELYDPIGAVVIKKDKDGIPSMWIEEEETDDLDIEMDIHGDIIDSSKVDFFEICVRQQKLLEKCHKLIETNGVLIDDYK